MSIVEFENAIRDSFPQYKYPNLVARIWYGMPTHIVESILTRRAASNLDLIRFILEKLQHN